MIRSFALAACVLGAAGTAFAMPVTPSFTSGTITANTQSTTTVNEVIRQQDYSNGYTYVVTGVNVRANDTGAPVSLSYPGNGTTAIATPTCVAGVGNICYGTSYSVINPGAAFQLTETYTGPGIFRDTAIDRTTTQTSITTSTSVFTQ
ncbi:MAG: hypothetical protein NTV57_17945 [Cyanobacteria bacterium]|nr:hypothetical protein [Cyanobacteriota bacterium]